MSKRSQLLFIALTVLVISSATSHMVARWCHVMTKMPPLLNFGKEDAPGTDVAAGSSLTFFGIAWTDVAEALKVKVLGLACPRGSATELEVLQRRAPPVQCTFVGISVFDSNENYLSDYRAQLVPLHETVANLWSARADWAFSKKILSQYPLKYIRMVFPTAGMSSVVMVGMREGLRKLVHTKSAAAPVSEGAVITDKGNSHLENIGTWPAARMDRNIADTRSSEGGELEFNGPKRQALFRLLRNSATEGKVVVLVMPESPTYRSQFLTDDVKSRFEALTAEAQKQVPGALWVRIDHLPELRDDKYYWDLIHLNAYGQAIATRALMRDLATAGIQ